MGIISQLPEAAIEIPSDRLSDFCAERHVARLELFGSVLRDDFGADSDVDVLVTFAPDARWSLFDIMEMEEQLAGIFGRAVDLVERTAIERSRNWLRRNAILSGSQVIYVA